MPVRRVDLANHDESDPDAAGAAVTADVTALFEQLGRPALIVDGDATVLEINHSAATIVARCEGLYLDGRALSSRRPHVRTTLHRDIAAAASHAPESSPPLAIPRPRGQSPLALVAIPLAPRLAHGRALALVLIVDPDATAAGIDALQRLFDLSTAEARLAGAIARGLTPPETAQEFGLSVHTVKAQLRAVFRKTGCRRQTDLVRMAAALAALGPR